MFTTLSRQTTEPLIDNVARFESLGNREEKFLSGGQLGGNKISCQRRSRQNNVILAGYRFSLKEIVQKKGNKKPDGRNEI